LATITLAISALSTTFGCGSPPAPAVDSCAAEPAGSIDTLEIGAGVPPAFGTEPPFMPLADGDGMKLVHGAQGANMLGFVLRVSGATAPQCLHQQTMVADSAGARVTSSTSPLATYAQPDGTRTTKPLWLPAEYPTMFVVDVTADNQSVALHLHLTQ
jgi:hypothetical protein